MKTVQQNDSVKDQLDEGKPIPFDQVIRKLVNTPPIRKSRKAKIRKSRKVKFKSSIENT